MPFLSIFFLVTVVAPLPTTFLNKSQHTPSQQKLTIPEFVKDPNHSEAAHKGHTSSESFSLPENHAYKNVSAMELAKIKPLSSYVKKMANKNSTAIIISENVQHGNVQKLEHYKEKPLSPLVLKLDRRYTPVEIAEYIFTTGDEKGFSQGVAEMLEDGQIMSSRDDVLIFLEAVQRELTILRRKNRVDRNA